MHDDRIATRNPQSQLLECQTEIIESATETVISAQLQLMSVMSQWTLTWLSLPAAIAGAYADARSQERSDPASLEAKKSNASAVLWPPAAPLVSGVEDMLGDQFFAPRPCEKRERDVMTLWKQGDEFQPVPYPVHTDQSDGQRAA